MVVNTLKSSESVEWKDWYNSELISLCKAFIELGLCEKYDDRLLQYEEFEQVVMNVRRKTVDMLKIIINGVPDLKLFMIIHSVFGINDNKKSDWLVRFLIKELVPTEEDIKNLHQVDKIPQDILDQLKAFDPKPIGFDKYLQNIRIEYKMWGDRERGEQTDPVKVIDRDWEMIGKEMELRANVSEFISKYKVIDIQ
jgi:hypothetical protein